MNKFGNKFNSWLISAGLAVSASAFVLGLMSIAGSSITAQAANKRPSSLNYSYEDYEQYEKELEAFKAQPTIELNNETVEKYFYGGVYQALREVLTDEYAASKIIINAADFPVIEDSRRLSIYSNKELDLGGATLKRSDSSSANFLVTGLPEDNTSGYAYTNIKICNGYIDGGKNDAGLCRFARVDGLTLENLKFRSFGKHAAEFAGVKNVKITNCTFEKPSYKVKSIKSGYEALSFDMTSHDEDFRDYGQADYLTCKNVTIYNCTFKDLYRGLGSHHYINKNYYEKIVIDKCKFVNIEDTAVECAGWINSKIKNCTFNKVGFGIDFKQPATSIKNSKTYSAYNCNSTIENNTFVIRKSGNKTFNSAIRVGGFTLDKKTNGVKKGIYYLNKFTVKNNTVKGKSTYCIIVDYTKNTVVTGNKTSGAAVRGISFWYAPGHVDKNNVDTSKKKSK